MRHVGGPLGESEQRGARPAAAKRRAGAQRLLTIAQLVPIAAMAFILTACGATGPGDGTGSAADFFTSRRSDIFLRGFFARAFDATNANTNRPPLTSWSPYFNANETAFAGGGRSDGFSTTPDLAAADFSIDDLVFDDVFANLQITNGISARLDSIALEFSEVDGTALVDFRVTPPTAIPGAFNFVIRSAISLFANPITSTGLPLTEPLGSPTVFSIPINIFKSGIYEFLLDQPRANRRPFLCKMTLTGRDILDGAFTIVGFLMVSPVLQTQLTTNRGGGGGPGGRP